MAGAPIYWWVHRQPVQITGTAVCVSAAAVMASEGAITVEGSSVAQSQPAAMVADGAITIEGAAVMESQDATMVAFGQTGEIISLPSLRWVASDARRGTGEEWDMLPAFEATGTLQNLQAVTVFTAEVPV